MGNLISTKYPIPVLGNLATKEKELKNLSSNTNLRLIPVQEMMSKSIETDWLIEGYIPANSTIMLFGKPETGKSLGAQDMSYCIGNGKNYHGHNVTQGTVIYVAGEGHAGLNKRFTALQKHNKKNADNVLLTNISIDLNSSSSTKELIEIMRDISDIKLIVIDTVHRNFLGDENNAKDFGAVMKNCDQLRLTTGATILLVHHSGHSDNQRARGSSSIKAALDVEYSITKKSNDVVMRCTKSKDIEKPMDKSFVLTMVDLGKTRDGSDISAPVLTSVNNVIKKTNVSGGNKVVYDHLKVALDESDLKVSGDEVFNADNISIIHCEPNQIKIHKDKLFEVSEKDIIVKSKPDSTESTIRSSKRKNFNRSLDKLIDSGLVAKDKDGFLIIPSSKEEDEIP